jgi:hypothetical protein
MIKADLQNIEESHYLNYFNKNENEKDENFNSKEYR